MDVVFCAEKVVRKLRQAIDNFDIRIEHSVVAFCKKIGVFEVRQHQ
jgi:hypothetical protein